jgi:hypothetical protein
MNTTTPIAVRTRIDPSQSTAWMREMNGTIDRPADSGLHDVAPRTQRPHPGRGTCRQVAAGCDD